MGAVSSAVEAVSDVASGVGDIASGAIEGVANIGSEVDDFVNDQIPGGWATVAAITAATAGQIAFPASQNASANANTLDDEEDSWEDESDKPEEVYHDMDKEIK